MLKKFVGLSASLVLVACGDSGSSGSPAVFLDESVSIVIAGQVADAVSRAPLAGVDVELVAPGSEEALRSGTTDEGGNYSFSEVPGSDAFQVRYKLANYRQESYESIDTTTGAADLVLESVRLVSNDNVGQGSIEGVITNAVDGLGIPGLSLACRRGINAQVGQVVASGSTGEGGSFLLEDIEYGNLTCEIAGADFVTAYATVLALGNITLSNQNSSVSPKLAAGAFRIVLSWGATPRDLDSHLTGPQADSDRFFHVFYARRTTDLVNLDVDDTTSFGPETITIDQQLPGVYRYTVLDFSNRSQASSTALASSNAQIDVFDTEGLVQRFFVPSGAGNLWTVFDLRGSVITPINTITAFSSDEDFFPPEARGNGAGLSFSGSTSLPAK